MNKQIKRQRRNRRNRRSGPRGLVPTTPGEALFRVRIGFEFPVNSTQTGGNPYQTPIDLSLLKPSLLTRFTTMFGEWRMLAAVVHFMPSLSSTTGPVLNLPHAVALALTGQSGTLPVPSDIAAVMEYPNAKLVPNNTSSGTVVSLSYKSNRSKLDAKLWTPTLQTNEEAQQLVLIGRFTNSTSTAVQPNICEIYGYLDLEFRSLQNTT